MHPRQETAEAAAGKRRGKNEAKTNLAIRTLISEARAEIHHSAMKAPHISTRPARILRHGLFTAALTPSLMPLHATTVLSPVNLLPAGSPGAIASQSSNPYGFPASRVNDGIVTGANPDFNHTNNALGEWVRLDLNADADRKSVV